MPPDYDKNETMNTRYKGTAIAAIRACTDRETLDATLALFGITDKRWAIELLAECMYSPQTFPDPVELSDEDKLELTKEMFLTGVWRLNEYYDRMGPNIIMSYTS